MSHLGKILAYVSPGDRVISDVEVYAGSYSGNFLGGAGWDVVPFGPNPQADTWYLATPYTADFDLSGGGDFYIEAYFNVTAFTNEMSIVSKDTYGSNFDWALIVKDDTTLRVWSNATTTDLTVTVPTMNTGQWYHFKFERVSGVNTIYLDGVDYGNNTMSISNSSTSYVTVGCSSWNNPGMFFNGYVDNIRINKGTDSMFLKFEGLNPDKNSFTDDTGKIFTILPEAPANIMTDNVDVVRDGLVVYLDSMNLKSYDRTGTTWVNLANPGTSDATLSGGFTFDTATGGISFDGVSGQAVYNMNLTAEFTAITIAKSNTSLWTDYGNVTSARELSGYVMHPFQADTLFAVSVMTDQPADLNVFSLNDFFTPADIQQVHLYGLSSNGTNVHYGYFDEEAHSIPGTITRTDGTNVDVYIGNDSPPYNTRFGNITVFAHLYYNRQLTPEEVVQNLRALRSHFQ